MLKKIKDIYQVQNLKGNDPLILWHNKVIDKFPYDLTIADVARCIRQNLFIDTVYEVCKWCESIKIFLLGTVDN